MGLLQTTLRALLALADRDEPDGILPVNQVIDLYTLRVGGSLDDRLMALRMLREAFEEKAPATEIAGYALEMIDNRRRNLMIDWQEARAATRTSIP
jgi:hypothetical protein